MTTTRRSFNEIATTIRKASVGAGCPFGTADDIGRAAVWFHRDGENSIETVLIALADVALAAKSTWKARCWSSTMLVLPSAERAPPTCSSPKRSARFVW